MSGVSPAIFESGGQRSEHSVPGVYSRSFNVSSPSGISAGNLCILGKSNGGKPFAMTEFGSVADAQKSLVGGELLDSVAAAFDASNTYIPQKVYAMRVNDGTQSSYTMKVGANDLLKLKSWDWGAHCNQLSIRVTSGNTGKNIVIKYKDKEEVAENIINPIMTIVYNGDGVNPTISVGTDKITLSAATEGETPEPTDVEEFTFEDFPSIDVLIERINTTDSWAATAITSDSNMASNKLDTISNAEVSTDGLILNANFEAFINALKAMTLIGDVEILDTSIRQAPDNIDTFQYFTGGTIGDYTITQWQQALEALELEDVQIIATPSTAASIHALISTHCTSMSNVINRKERTCILGGGIGMTDEEAIAEAQSLNNRLVSFVCDNATKINLISGKEETISGAMLGVMLAGMESAMSPNTPLTFKQMKVLKFAKIRNIANITKLIKAGIMVCNPNPEDLSDYICIRALTTYQGNDLINNERSMVREDLFMNRDLRAQFKPVIGTTGITANAAIQTLKDRAKQWALNGYIVPTDSNENVWDIKVSIDGDKIYVTYSRYLTAPVNFVFITAVNHIYTSTVEM